ncbi:MAG: hypothetical protein ACC742_02110 [Thermoanaerobaculales bacterium]
MRRTIVLTVVMMAWAVMGGAQSVAPGGTIPAVSNISGEQGTFWRSDVSILNLNPSDTSVVLVLLPELRNDGPSFEPLITDPIPVPGGGQITLANVVTSQFDLRNVKGGLSIFSSDGSPLVIASRTYTNSDQGGTFGLSIYGVLLVDAETAWVAAVEHDGFYRTNLGIFMPADPVQPVIFSVTVRDNVGTEVGSGSLLFDRAGLKQKSLKFFGVGTLLDGWVEIRCSDPSVIWYGYAAVVDEVTGDSVYQPAVTYQGTLP